MKRKGRRKKRKLRKEIAGIAVITIFVALMIALYISQQGARAPKEPAEEYYRIFDTTVNDADPITNDTVVERWILYWIGFKIQAIGGDAHNVVIKSWAQAPHEEVGDIPEGEYRYVDMMSPRPYGYNSEINEDGKVPMQITITSTEAEGAVMVYF